MHLIFLIHGLFGNPGHLSALKEVLEKKLDSKDVIVYRARANSALATFDGVEESARRCYEELRKVVEENKPTEISVVGYSLGGLLGRYVVGLLEDDQWLGTTPVLFATFATPHLGVRFNGGSFGSAIMNWIGAHMLGPSGPDLFGRSPVLAELADPSLRYYVGLRKFKHLLLYANCLNDRTVPFWTAYITIRMPVIPHSSGLFVDLGNTTSVVARSRSASERLQIGALICLSPIFITVMLSILTFATIWSWTRRYVFGRKSESRVENTVVGAAGEMVEDVLTEVPSSEEEPELVVKGKPLQVSDSVREQADALNRLPWKKVAVLIRHLNSHGEIVDRRRRYKDGYRVLTNFGDYMKSVV